MTASRAQKTAAAATLAVAALLFVLLHSLNLSLHTPDATWPPEHSNDVQLVVEETFVEVVREPAPVKSQAPAARAAKSTVAKARTDTKRESPPPSRQQIEARRQAEASRRVSDATASAFSKAVGKTPARDAGTASGTDGTPTGAPATDTDGKAAFGAGTGTVGGGWGMPAYAKVPATVTGSIKMKLTIGRDGRVTAVQFQGGDAPAATSPALRRAVEAEVRSRRFTRPNADDAPPTATAYVTYRFK